MDAAAGQLLGLGDFAAFCKRREGATTVRTLLAFMWTRDVESGVVEATVVADAFCHSMVRALAWSAVSWGWGGAIPSGHGRCSWPAFANRASW